MLKIPSTPKVHRYRRLRGLAVELSNFQSSSEEKLPHSIRNLLPSTTLDWGQGKQLSQLFKNKYIVNEYKQLAASEQRIEPRYKLLIN